jgi:hypothetical protein
LSAGGRARRAAAIAAVAAAIAAIAAAGDTALFATQSGWLARFDLACVAAAQVSPDGRLAAIAFDSGRIALVDLGALRAAMTPGRAAPKSAAETPADCPGGDPLELDAAADQKAPPGATVSRALAAARAAA